MESQNLQLSFDFLTVQLYILLELKYMIPKLSEGAWSIVLCLKMKRILLLVKK